MDALEYIIIDALIRNGIVRTASDPLDLERQVLIAMQHSLELPINPDDPTLFYYGPTQTRFFEDVTEDEFRRRVKKLLRNQSLITRQELPKYQNTIDERRTAFYQCLQQMESFFTQETGYAIQFHNRANHFFYDESKVEYFISPKMCDLFLTFTPQFHRTIVPVVSFETIIDDCDYADEYLLVFDCNVMQENDQHSSEAAARMDLFLSIGYELVQRQSSVHSSWKTCPWRGIQTLPFEQCAVLHKRK